MFSSLVNFLLAAASMVPFFAPPMELQIPRCIQPAERREWRTLSKADRAEWIRAVKCLANMPHSDALIATDKPVFAPPINVSGSYYDDVVYIHMDLGARIHSTGLFFPWHRHYVHMLEEAMKSQCGYTGVSPYWDWTQDAADFEGASIFQDSDPISGLGGWGDPSSDVQVLDGGFSALSSFRLSYPYPHTLRRNFTLRPYINEGMEFHNIPELMANTTFTKSEVEKLVNGFEGDFRAFQAYLESYQGAHFSVHSIMGGDMAGVCTEGAPAGCISSQTSMPNEPMFWLHHAMVDKIWFDWQNKHPANTHAFSGGSVIRVDNTTEYDKYPVGGPPDLTLDSILPADGLFSTVTVGDVLSTTGGLLCYVYV